MEAAHLRDITGVTQQPWARRGGGSLPQKFGLPFAGDEIQSQQVHRESTRAGEETLWALKSSGFKIVRGSWTVWFRGNLADSRSYALAADRTSHCCDSRRLWRKPYLVKVFVAVTQRDQPAINSAGGGREINAYIILRAAKQSNKLRSLLRVKTVNRISLTFT